VQYPPGHATLLQALEEFLHAPQIVILRGPLEVLSAWQQALERVYAPRRMVLAIADATADLPPSLASKSALPGGAAYVCRGQTCSAPLRSWEALSAELAT
jgi:uncharacterized protein YyaL (SSP411 family)